MEKWIAVRSKLGKELLNIVIGGFRKENILKTSHNPGNFRTEKKEKSGIPIIMH